MNAPLVFKTYQDVKNNILYWTVVLLIVSGAVVYAVFLGSSEREAMGQIASRIGGNALYVGLTVVGVPFLLLAASAFLVFWLEIHDVVYDRLVIKWREQYDVDFIIANLTKPFSASLPGNFLGLARTYRYDFMKPYYEFVGDGKPGIQQNTRVRFYEQVTKYWLTQMNELFILAFAIVTPILVLAQIVSIPSATLAGFFLGLVALAILNRWLIRVAIRNTRIATTDEIEEILAKEENVGQLEAKYLALVKKKGS